MVGTSRGQTESDWVVDIATGRVVRHRPADRCTGLDGQTTLRAHATDWDGKPLTDEKQREQAKKDFSPIEDIKGAIRFMKDLDPIEEVKEFMETAARVLEPSESDLRVIEPQDDSESEMQEHREPGRAVRPDAANAQPDPKALNKEHRGY